MSIGILGVFVFLLTLFLINKPNKLLYATVFFAPFCASSVVSFSTFFLQPGHYFMFLYILISTFTLFSRHNGILLTKNINKSNKWLFSFLSVAFISIVLSVCLRIDVPVYGVGTAGNMKSSLVSFQNFTQLLYLILGYIMYLFVFNNTVKSKDNWNKIVNIFSISGIVVLLIGVYQIIATQYGLPYDEIFRNNVKKMWQTKLRAQATFGEASYLGQFCVYLLAIYFTVQCSSKKFFQALAIVLTFVIGLLSVSSTFLFGMLALLVGYFVFKKIDKKTIIRYLIICVIAPVSMIYLINSNVYVQSIISMATAKLQLKSFSGVERANIFSYMLNIGLQYPVLGIGYGGGRSRDLYTNLFSNVGLVGLVIFMGFILKDFIFLIKNRKFKPAMMGILVLFSFIVTSCANPDLSYLPIWVLFGLIDSLCIHIKNKTI